MKKQLLSILMALAQCLGLSGTVLLEQGGIDRKGRPYGIGRDAGQWVIEN